MKNITIIALSLSLLGCSHSVQYSHSQQYDVMTIESRSDNLHDYSVLRDKAQHMCILEGYKWGILVVDSHPTTSSQSSQENSTMSYTMSYKCNEPSLTDRAFSSYKQLQQAVK